MPGLRRVQDRRRHQRAEDAAVGDGEGAAGQLVDRELAVAGATAELGDLAFDLGEAHAVGIAHHRHHETLLGADRDADVIVVLEDDVVAVDLAVDGRDLLQRLDAGLARRSP